MGAGLLRDAPENYPDLERRARVVNIGWLGVQLLLANGGSCFLPIRMAQPLIETGRLFQVSNGPEIARPAYMVFPRESDSDVLQQAVHGLREQAGMVLARSGATEGSS